VESLAAVIGHTIQTFMAGIHSQGVERPEHLECTW